MIRCEGLTAGYGRVSIINGMDWSAAAGKLNVVIGPNGSGKSTLLKAVMGQAGVFGGRIFVGEKDISELNSREAAKCIAYLPQNRNDTNISVYRMVLHGRFPYISYPRHYTEEDGQKVEQALDRMGISHLKNRPVSELSGGEKQKAYLAMAMVQETPVLLLDEPATYLDLPCQLELMRLLCSLKKEGKTIITVLHDLNHALLYADEILLMEKGKKVFQGNAEDIISAGKLEEVFKLKVNRLTDGEGSSHYFFS